MCVYSVCESIHVGSRTHKVLRKQIDCQSFHDPSDGAKVFWPLSPFDDDDFFELI